ncbi:phosphoethanolamine transferase [Tamlana sp. 2_MG-2023]|nr:phosphoethanolamine transferase [Tamlana sp. 2_MG-2023]MDO6790111.1 phosphoethanolamine transferase [Tamlana sp. 1_MG-2023]
MFLLIESNSQELEEFWFSYIDVKVILFLILMIIMFLVIRKLKFQITNSNQKILGGIISAIIIVALKLTGLIENNTYFNVVRGVYGYFDLQGSIELENVGDIKDIETYTDNQILVVVIGESTARKHMQVYGYDRLTTPNLNRIRDELLLYNNTISTDVITTKSLPFLLTSASKNDKETTSYSIIDVFNEAGFSTYWLSNQRPIGHYDNKTSEIASAVGYLKFLNHKDEVKTNSHDEVLFPEFDLALKGRGKKVIFLHLIGTHFEYSNRYPKTYNNFNDSTVVSKKGTIINHYDNAVLYNDYIVYSLIEKLKNKSTRSALLYLSDHGENVYDEGTNFFGRNEERLTKTMFDIPFFVWTSKDFELPNDFEYHPNRAFMADHTYESILHLFGVKYQGLDFSRSIFSNNFIERKRFVVDGIDYETRFKNE